MNVQKLEQPKQEQAKAVENPELDGVVEKARVATEKALIAVYESTIPELGEIFKNVENLKKLHRVQYNKAFKCV